MINKKINRLLSSILGIALIGGIFQMPVFADDNVQATSTYTESTTSAAVTYKDYSINVNKSAEQNGLKVTLTRQ